MNLNILQPLLNAVSENDAILGTNLALLHIINQNKLAELEPDLAKYLQSDELFYEQKAGKILSHLPQELRLLGQEKYLVPVIYFATGRAFNDTVLRMQKECGITDNLELSKLKSTISDMYLAGLQDSPDIHKIKALSSTLLGTLNNSDKFLLTSQDPVIVLHALNDNISSQLHHAIAQEIKDINNIKDITFCGDEVLWRGIQLPESINIEEFLGLSHNPSMYSFYLPPSEEAPLYPCDRVCTSAGLYVPMDYGAQKKDAECYTPPIIGYLLEIRPKMGQKATLLSHYNNSHGLCNFEVDFDKFDTHEVYAAYIITRLDKESTDAYCFGYEIQQVCLNKSYIEREADTSKLGLHFAEGDKIMLNHYCATRLEGHQEAKQYWLTLTPAQLESGKLVRGEGETCYTFAEHPNYRHFEAAYFKEINTPLPDEDPDEKAWHPEEENYIPPKIDLPNAQANRQETAGHDAVLYPYMWPHSDDF